MKLKELSKYTKYIYHIIKIYGLGTNSVYIVLRIIFDIKIYISTFSTLKEAIKYVENIFDNRFDRVNL